MIASEFVVFLCLFSNTFSATMSVCKVLQSPYCDLTSAVDHIESIVGHFENLRKTIDLEFSKILKTAESLMRDVGDEIRLPRLVPHQRHRSNYSTKDPQTYFRISVAIPILDDLIDQLKCRFTNHKELLVTLQCFLPTSATEKSSKLYENMVDLELVSSEYLLWKLFWEKQMKHDKPSCAIEALSQCNRELFPNIFKLLMSVHRSHHIPTEKVIDEFARKKNRRLDFVF
uniref:Uncharacterized protein n=1 Tax=Cuerna arida TaxID=1464854 RepID=A0A1B6F3A3_9HEMI